LRKPKDLFFEDGQKVLLTTEILLFLDYRRISVKNARKLGKWLLKATEYLETKKEKPSKPEGFVF
jgi:hypothetical protein